MSSINGMTIISDFYSTLNQYTIEQTSVKSKASISLQGLKGTQIKFKATKGCSLSLANVIYYVHHQKTTENQKWLQATGP